MIISQDYADKILEYFKTHEYASWMDLYNLLDKPNPNTLNFILHKLRFNDKKIEIVEMWRLKKDDKISS